MPGIPLHLGPLSLDLSSEFASCSSASPFCESNIYSTKHIETPSKAAMEEIYSTNHVLCGEGNEISTVKCQTKTNFIQTVWDSISENMAQNSRILSKMNNSLSVTVVDNDIINTKFFENSVEYKKHLSTDKPYNFEIQEKKSLDIMKQIRNTCLEGLESVDTFKSFIMGHHEKHWAYYDDDNDNCRIWINKNKNVENSTQNMGFNDTCKDNNAMESHMSYICETEKLNNTDNSCPMDVDLEECTDSSKEKKLNKEKTVPLSYNIDINEDASMSAESFCVVSESDVPPMLIMNPIKEIPISTHLSDMCEKIWKGVTNPFYCKPTYVQSEVTMKHSKHWKKINAVATGKGRGRAKSQLRRSGVSQTSHRHQHTRHLDINVQDDYESWQDVEVYHTIQNNLSLSNKPNSFNDADGYDVTDDAQPIKQTVNPITFEFPDILSVKDKSLTQKGTQQGATKSIQVRCILDSSIMIDEDCKSETFSQDVPHRDSLRSRLLSESSVESEDSFCIFFEAGSETENTIDVDCDEINSSDQDSEDDSIDTINEDDQSSEELTMQVRKVKFNPTPIVHVMVKWDYAYRAARKGPWEEMARDNERFRGRINSIAAVLNPILTSQHRSQVWQERFAFQE